MALPRILCYGDSNTAGFFHGGQEFHPYAKYLKQYLANSGLDAEVQHDGHSGLTAQELLQKVASGAIRDVCGKIGKGLQLHLEEQRWDLVIINLGTNDVGKGTAPRQALHYVKELHGVCHDRNVPTFAIGPPTIPSGPARTARDQLARMIQQYAGATKDVMAYEDLEKFVPRVPGNWDTDQLHMSPQGAHLFAKGLCPTLLKFLSGGPSSKMAFKQGQAVHFFDGSRWILTQVAQVKNGGGITVVADPQTTITASELASKIRVHDALTVGEEVEYFSESKQEWMQCKVVEVRPDGAAKLDIKSDWFSLDEQENKIRHKAAQSTDDCGISITVPPLLAQAISQAVSAEFVVGQPVEYFSPTLGKWIPCKVLDVSSNGDVQTDVKHGGKWVTKSEQFTKLRAVESNSKSGPYGVGDHVEYYSITQKQWYACTVLSVDAAGTVQVDAKPNCFVPPGEVADKIRPHQPEPPRTFVLGDEVEYYSARLTKWMKCNVVQVNAHGEIRINLRPTYWIGIEEQHEKIRSPGKEEVGFRVGQAVEYYSVSLNKWLPAHITQVRPNGDLLVDVKPDAVLQKATLEGKIRIPKDSRIDVERDSWVVGDEVDFYMEDKLEWRKTKVIEVDEKGSVRLEINPYELLSLAEQDKNMRLAREDFLWHN